MDKIIAYCGLNCAGCPAYVATQSGDPAALERVAAEWRVAFNAPEMTAESIICDGCLASIDGRLADYCSICEIRACAIERGVVNCAFCDDYGCAKLEGFLAQAPEARKTLEQLRAA
ncbi:MAG: DUF3795 domain-containing protein [Anaerolineae bacterium]|nr:DUF3795 domain-containing protein [Anaerolineae bacterium]